MANVNLNNAGIVFIIRSKGGAVGRVSCRRAVYDPKIKKMVPFTPKFHIFDTDLYASGFANATAMLNLTMSQLMDKNWDKPALIIASENVANRYFSALKKINAELRNGTAPEELDAESIAGEIAMDWMDEDFKTEVNAMVELMRENLCRKKPVSIGVMRSNNLEYMELDVSEYMGELKADSIIKLTNSVYEDECGIVKVRDNNTTTGDYTVSTMQNGDTIRYYVKRKIDKNVSLKNAVRMRNELDMQLPDTNFVIAEEAAVAVGDDEF